VDLTLSIIYFLIFSVGMSFATESKKDQLVKLSARGPTKDGRIKPDLIAPGDHLISANARPDLDDDGDGGGVCDDGPIPNRTETSEGLKSLAGTSMAAPVVTGTATLLRQYFEEGRHVNGAVNLSKGFQPRASLLKAALVNCATPLTSIEGGESTVEYDFNQGFGRATLGDALPLESNGLRAIVENNREIQAGRYEDYWIGILISDECRSEKVSATLVWTDIPGALGCVTCLLNDLDLEMTPCGGDVTLYPNGKHKADDVNTVERIRSEFQHGDVVNVRVTATNLMDSYQEFSLIVTGCFEMVDRPSSTPSHAPSDSSLPSASRLTSTPSNAPSFFPSNAPSDVPSNVPSDVPSNAPSFFPSNVPSDVPSNAPSDVPSNVPSNAPSFFPSNVPSGVPSGVRSKPSDAPSQVPPNSSSSGGLFMETTAKDSYSDDTKSSKSSSSSNPSSSPSSVPSNTPSLSPSNSSFSPSSRPSVSPTIILSTISTPTSDEVGLQQINQMDHHPTFNTIDAQRVKSIGGAPTRYSSTTLEENNEHAFHSVAPHETLPMSPSPPLFRNTAFSYHDATTTITTTTGSSAPSMSPSMTCQLKGDFCSPTMVCCNTFMCDSTKGNANGTCKDAWKKAGKLKGGPKKDKKHKKKP
jgi:hypothetical protein